AARMSPGRDRVTRAGWRCRALRGAGQAVLGQDHGGHGRSWAVAFADRPAGAPRSDRDCLARRAAGGSRGRRAGLTAGVPAPLGMACPWVSMTKIVTATSAMRLADPGPARPEPARPRVTALPGTRTTRRHHRPNPT